MPKQVDKEERRQAILEAAVDVFVDEGYQFMSVEDIAQRAGVSKGTVYFYFEDKADILYEAFQWFEDGLHQIVEETRVSEDPPARQLEKGLRNILDFTTSNRALVQILIDSWLASRHDPKQTKIDFPAFYRRLLEPIRELVEYGRSTGAFREDLPDHYPAIVIGSVQGMLFEWMVDPDSLPLESLKDEIHQILIDPIRSDSD